MSLSVLLLASLPWQKTLNVGVFLDVVEMRSLNRCMGITSGEVCGFIPVLMTLTHFVKVIDSFKIVMKVVFCWFKLKLNLLLHCFLVKMNLCLLLGMCVCVRDMSHEPVVFKLLCVFMVWLSV